MYYLLTLIVIILLAWGIRILRVELTKLETEIIKLEKSNKELLEVNYKLTKKLDKNLKH